MRFHTAFLAGASENEPRSPAHARTLSLAYSIGRSAVILSPLDFMPEIKDGRGQGERTGVEGVKCSVSSEQHLAHCYCKHTKRRNTAGGGGPIASEPARIHGHNKNPDLSGLLALVPSAARCLHVRIAHTRVINVYGSSEFFYIIHNALCPGKFENLRHNEIVLA